MNCSHNCMMCRVWKYIKKHFKNFVIKTIIFFNMLSLMYWIVYIDYIISWQPYAIMAFNLLVLSLIGYANKDNGVDFLQQQKRILKTGLKNTLRNMVVGGSNTGVVQLTQKEGFLIYW